MPKYVPVYDMIIFDGTNVNEIPDNLINPYGPGTGRTSVVDGVLTITWPDFPGSGSQVINTGDAIRSDGFVIGAADLDANYIPASQVHTL